LPAAVERDKRLLVAASHPQEEFVVLLRRSLRHGFFTHDSRGAQKSSIILPAAEALTGIASLVKTN
jgi:hypothetical protein